MATWDVRACFLFPSHVSIFSVVVVNWFICVGGCHWHVLTKVTNSPLVIYWQIHYKLRLDMTIVVTRLVLEILVWQCDQIGRFLMVLGDKSSPNIIMVTFRIKFWKNLGYFYYNMWSHCNWNTYYCTYWLNYKEMTWQ